MSRHCLAGLVWGSKSSEAEFEQLGPVDGKINAQQARQKMVEAGIRAWENLILKIDRLQVKQERHDEIQSSKIVKAKGQGEAISPSMCANE